MRTSDPINIVWLRRDLRLHDNTALSMAAKSGLPILCLFIFDTDILDALDDKADARVTFIYDALRGIDEGLRSRGGALLIKKGTPLTVWAELLTQFHIREVHAARDYEPYATDRDAKVADVLRAHEAKLYLHKDQVVFENREVVKENGTPYTVFTPYSKAWKNRFEKESLFGHAVGAPTGTTFFDPELPIPSLAEIGFERTALHFPTQTVDDALLTRYAEQRNLPAVAGTSRLSVHLRFGTVSIRELVAKAYSFSQTWLSELIWREFYMMILANYPHVVNSSFKPEYDNIPWRDDPAGFERWCEGQTGYPLVDAGMRELNTTGYMHNRVRMVTASFLTKHLLIDWRKGERYFAKKLLDYDLSANNGGWQWAAGSGCDAAPYYRIFNPTLQAEKFDPESVYIKKWVPEVNSSRYPTPIIEHAFARARCLAVFKQALGDARAAAATLFDE